MAADGESCAGWRIWPGWYSYKLLQTGLLCNSVLALHGTMVFSPEKSMAVARRVSPGATKGRHPGNA
jgi:hypothetical protein